MLLMSSGTVTMIRPYFWCSDSTTVTGLSINSPINLPPIKPGQTHNVGIPMPLVLQVYCHCQYPFVPQYPLLTMQQ